jgi:hypothetical protein
MSRTVRNYPKPFGTKQDGAIRLSKYLKRLDRYTGYVGENIWNAKAKKRHKRIVERANRRTLNKNGE